MLIYLSMVLDIAVENFCFANDAFEMYVLSDKIKL